MSIYNQAPRPRVLFEGIPDPLFKELSQLVPTATQVQPTERIHESEFDLLVTYAGNAAARTAKLHVLSFGAIRLDGVPVPHGVPIAPPYPRLQQSTMANEVSIPENVEPDLRKLLESSVVPTIPEGEKLTWVIPQLGSDRAKILVELGPEKSPYALIWNRKKGPDSALTLALPMEATSHRDWLLWMLAKLHHIAPDTFPGQEEWATTSAWASGPTVALHEALSLSQERTKRVIAEAQAKETADQRALEQAQLSDAIGLQKLLTADGEELEAAVVDALNVLGFSARTMDDHHDAVTKAKLEDLRVTDPSEPGWVCLVEIKGYSKGAKTNDINQITGKPLLAFALETGSSPSALWHVVNIKRGSAPHTRGSAVPNDLDLGHLASVGGVLIDSRQLFLAVQDVQLGVREASEVRRELRDSTMRWKYRIETG